MPTLDEPRGTGTIRKIAVVDITGNTPSQIESAFNNNYGLKGWRIVQVIVISTKTYLIAERTI